MKAGRLDRKIRLERGTVVSDGFNDSIGEPWNLIAEVRAEATPISDAERWRAGEVGATITHRFVIRYGSSIADLNPKDRLIYDGRTYDISAVKEIGRREWLEITAAARAD